MTQLASTKVIVGKVLQPHGVNGQVKITTDSDNPNRFQKNQSLIIDERVFFIQDSILVDNYHYLLKLGNISSRQKAKELQGLSIYVPVNATPELPVDMYYHYQLIEMTVVDSEDRHLGVLSEIIDTGANDVYVIKGDERELLLPAVGSVIQFVNVKANTMKITLPEGLEWRSTKPKNPKPKKKRINIK